AWPRCGSPIPLFPRQRARLPAWMRGSIPLSQTTWPGSTAPTRTTSWRAGTCERTRWSAFIPTVLTSGPRHITPSSGSGRPPSMTSCAAGPPLRFAASRRLPSSRPSLRRRALRADARRGARVWQRSECSLDLFAQVLEVRGQRDPFAQVLQRFVRREARPQRRDLEQDAARLPEVQRFEVVAVDYRRRARAGRDDLLAPGDVVFDCRRPRDVVHSARAAEAPTRRSGVVHIEGSAVFATRLVLFRP